jgi:hypothetical protein
MAKKPQNNPSQTDWDEPDERGDTQDPDEGFAQARDPEGDAAREELEADEAARRAELTNMQTTAEREEGRDAVSGTQNPGVVRDVTGHSAQGEAANSDMSGKQALPDPLKALDPKLVKEIHDKLIAADKRDVANFNPPKDADEETAARAKVAHERSSGWRSLADLGVHRDTLNALVKAGKVEEGAAPGMHHHGDTGKKFRVKRDRG